ncbi:MAG: hypothetical protein IJX14_06540, partial [Clostridia bacterium]|nr:hypothetical protein [Clostridia bacterium]
MNILYLQNNARKNELNSRGIDYTPAYIPAILAWLGASGKPVCPCSLDSLTENDVLLANMDDLEVIPENAGAVILLGGGESIRERKIHGHFLIGEERIPLFVPLIADDDASSMGEVLYTAEAENGSNVPALIKRNDRVYDFRFDLCATVWFSGDGFLPEGPSNYFFIGRTPDSRPDLACRYSAKPFNDHLLLVLEDILSDLGVPMLSRIPLTEDGEIPDFALHMSGDDDCTSADFNLNAARVANSLGLYYHVNAMPGGDKFVITKEQAEEMADLGCELALHTDYTVQPYTFEGQKCSADLYRSYFGMEPVTNVNHCLVEGGKSAERMRWLAACGIIADNGKLGEFDASDINAFNLMGFGFGTSFPRYTCDDAAHDNVLIECMEIPNTYYEPRLGGTYEGTEEMVKSYIDDAAAEGRIVQFFIHPHYLWHESPHAQWSVAALRLAKAYWEEKGYKIALTSTNRIAKFWQARKNAEITLSDGVITVKCDAPCALVLPEGVKSAETDGKTAEIVVKMISDRETALTAL